MRKTLARILIGSFLFTQTSLPAYNTLVNQEKKAPIHRNNAEKEVSMEVDLVTGDYNEDKDLDFCVKNSGNIYFIAQRSYSDNLKEVLKQARKLINQAYEKNNYKKIILQGTQRTKKDSRVFNISDNGITIMYKDGRNYHIPFV